MKVKVLIETVKVPIEKVKVQLEKVKVLIEKVKVLIEKEKVPIETSQLFITASENETDQFWQLGSRSINWETIEFIDNFGWNRKWKWNLLTTLEGVDRKWNLFQTLDVIKKW